MTSTIYQHQISLNIFLGVLLLIAVSNWLALRRLGRYPAPSQFLRVSVLVPARDEVETIGPALESLLAQDYPSFEILVLDDGSTDGTGEKLAALAAHQPRLRILKGEPLPEGWLGKHWACWQLAQAATGDLLFFTDADTQHCAGALREAVAALLAEEVDLLSGFLYQEVHSWGERLIVPTAFWCMYVFLPIALAYRVRWPWLSLTNGQLMLFRREAYQAVGGHAAVRTNPVDDIALGQRVKAQGLRWCIVDAGEYVRCRMYTSFREAVEGFSKNLFAVFDFRLAEYLFVWLWILLLTWEPLVVLLGKLAGLPLDSFALWPAALAVGEMTLLWGIMTSRLRFSPYLALLYPLSLTLFAGIAFRSLLLTILGRATWKGRSLPSQRVRLV